MLNRAACRDITIKYLYLTCARGRIRSAWEWRLADSVGGAVFLLLALDYGVARWNCARQTAGQGMGQPIAAFCGGEPIGEITCAFFRAASLAVR
jgi:hypothetical protein